MNELDALFDAAEAGDGDAALVLHDALMERSEAYVQSVATTEDLARHRGDVWILAAQKVGRDLLYTSLSPPDLVWRAPFEFGASNIRSPVGRPTAKLLGALNLTTSVRRGRGRPKVEDGPIALTYFTRTYT